MYTEKSAYTEPALRNFRLEGTDFHSPIFTKELVYYTFIRNTSYKKHNYFHDPDEFLISGLYCLHFVFMHFDLLFISK